MDDEICSTFNRASCWFLSIFEFLVDRLLSLLQTQTIIVKQTQFVSVFDCKSVIRIVERIAVSSSDGLKEVEKMRNIIGRTTDPTRRSTNGQWTDEEDELLTKAVQQFKANNWKKIAEFLEGRTDVQCSHRWKKVLDPKRVKGPWTKEEDDELLRLVEQFGTKKWSTIAEGLPGRIGKQCRERWHNHLNPDINKASWSQEEELTLIKAHQLHGNKWTEIKKYLPGRTDNTIKNHWNTWVRKKVKAYVDSGMLEQFQGLPTNHSVPTSSTSQQHSEDNSLQKDATEGEEILEYSQASTFVRCSQSNNDMANVMVPLTGDQDQPADMTQMAIQTRDEEQLADLTNEVLALMDDHTQRAEKLHPDCSSNSCLPCEFDDCSEFMEQHYSHGLPTSGRMEPSFSEFLRGEFDFVDCIPFDEPTCMRSQVLPENESNQFNGLSVDNQEFTGITFPNDSSNSHFFVDQDNVGVQPQYQRDENHVLQTQIHRSVDVNSALQRQQQESGHPSYDPPRFTSLDDTPFFSCDLTQPSGDLQDDYSPLGIHQLMNTSMECFTPCGLWGSPSLDDNSPEAVRKSAGNTLTSTPSVLKKRKNCDLMSPSSDQRCGKRQEHFSLCNLANNFSNSRVMLDENVNRQLLLSSQAGGSGLFFKDEENVNPTVDIAQEERGKSAAVEVEQPPAEVLLEQYSDHLFHSPDQAAINPEAFSCENPANDAFISPHRSCFAASTQPASSSVPAENPANDSSVENSGMLGETPFKKNLESPSALMSPCFSFVPGPRVDTDITLEDIGYFTLPGERS